MFLFWRAKLFRLAKVNFLAMVCLEVVHAPVSSTFVGSGYLSQNGSARDRIFPDSKYYYLLINLLFSSFVVSHDYTVIHSSSKTSSLDALSSAGSCFWTLGVLIVYTALFVPAVTCLIEVCASFPRLYHSSMPCLTGATIQKIWKYSIDFLYRNYVFWDGGFWDGGVGTTAARLCQRCRRFETGSKSARAMFQSPIGGCRLWTYPEDGCRIGLIGIVEPEGGHSG